MSNLLTAQVQAPTRTVPFFRAQITNEEMNEVLGVLRSGWLTTGPLVQQFEREFSEAVGARHAVAVNSCTAALHLAVEALGLKPGQGVLVPTMTFAATAEVVRYQGAVPILVDCDPATGHMDLADAERRLRDWHARQPGSSGASEAVGIMPVHVGGVMLDIGRCRKFAKEHGLWVVEDAAHALPSAWRPREGAPWQRCGEDTADVTCFSFYANKTITTGEGGMAVTSDPALAERMRLMSLHGLSRDAWSRYTSRGNWDYQIVAPGFKYNLTEIAAALGIHQLRRAESMRQARERMAARYRGNLRQVAGVIVPPIVLNRIHAWHLFQIQLAHSSSAHDRNRVKERLLDRGITCSVHWRPLHLHPYYRDAFNLRPYDFPNAVRLFDRTISLPLYPTMTFEDVDYVTAVIAEAAEEVRRS